MGFNGKCDNRARGGQEKNPSRNSKKCASEVIHSSLDSRSMSFLDENCSLKELQVEAKISLHQSGNFSDTPRKYKTKTNQNLNKCKTCMYDA